VKVRLGLLFLASTVLLFLCAYVGFGTLMRRRDCGVTKGFIRGEIHAEKVD